MTTTIVFANTNDAYLLSTDNSYATALAGPADSISTPGDTGLLVGQQKSGTPYTIWQSFLQFAIPSSVDLTTVSGYFRITGTSSTGTSVDRGLDFLSFGWGTLATGDWRPPTQLVNLYNNNKAGGVAHIQNSGNLVARAGYLDVQDLENSGTLQYIVSGSRNRTQQTPTGLEYNGFRSADFSGTDSDPAIFIAEITDSVLNRDLGAQVQLSDGTHVFIEFTSVTLGADAYTIKHRNLAGTVTTFNSATDQSVVRRGAQSHTLVRDKLDNLYVLSQSNTKNALHCRAFIKGVGYTWTAGTARIVAMPTHDQDINNIAMAWHPQGGTFGTIVALVGHQAGSNTGTEIAYALINCDHLINGSGTALRASGNANGLLVAATAIDGFHNFVNETGTLMDMSAGTTNSNTGFVMCTARHHVLGQNGGQSLARYTLNSGGTGFSEVWNTLDNFSGFSQKDANAKSRLIPLSATQYVTVNASPSTEFGIVVKHRQQQSNQFTTLSDVRLAEQGLTSMPASTVLAVSNNWDAIHNPLDNKIWVYYFDQADGRRLMRTHVDLNTGQAGQDEVEVNATVGATGSTNHAIRVHRHHTIGEQMLITVANETSGGTHSSIYLTDTINVAPSQPILIPHANFDSNTSTVFDWDFLDLNAGDTQSAFQLQIDNATTGATAWDTGKTLSTDSNYTLPASSIPNEEDWKWRVTTWDSQDAQSPVSSEGFFTTSASGSVTIIDPAVDNDPNIVTANYLVKWAVTGTTQTSYRVVVTRTDLGTTLINTGFVDSTDTQFLVEGMLSDIEWNVAVTVRDVSLVESNTANRLITPSYNAPEVPFITFDIQDSLGYIGLNITNPVPVGDRPNPSVNQIQRRVFNADNPSTRFQVIGQTTENGTFLDYTAASGVLYEYRVRAIAGEFFTDSIITPADRPLELQGLWLHDPTSEGTSIRQFLFGKDNRSTAIDTISTTQQFAGRTFPVVDFGEFELEDISVTVDIPHGPTYRTEEADLRAFMESKRTLFLRDNRGRAAYGTMSGYNQADQAWGIATSFKFSRVSFDIEEV